jgi:RNA polymerase subunit RPABC4/transcription elongation factor Spt4
MLGGVGMTLFDRFKHGVDVTKFKAEKLVRINRIQGEIDSLKSEIAAINFRISKRALELHKEGELANQDLVDLCLKIDQLQAQINDKNALIVSIRDEEAAPFVPAEYQTAPQNPCPQCYFDVELGAEFCPNCGAQMAAQATAAPTESDPAFKACTGCGASIPVVSKFCPECGQSAVAEDE